MEPIISPWLIYAMSLAVKMQMLCTLIAIFSGAAVVIVFLNIDFDNNGSMPKWLVFLFFSTLILAVAIPSQQTMYEMLAASYMTPDNLAAGEEKFFDLLAKILGVVSDAMNKH